MAVGFYIIIPICFFISLVLLFLTLLTSKKRNLIFEKSSPFECGFSPKMMIRTPFSIQFFSIALMFLIFDVELILLFPFLMKKIFFFNNVTLIVCMVFFFLLFIGLLHEWNQKTLQWN